MISRIESLLDYQLRFPFPPLPEHMILFYPHDRPLLKDVFRQKSRPAFRCTLVDPQTERFEMTMGRQHLVLKVRLRPGALHRFTHLPMNAMREEKDPDGEIIFGSEVRYVAEALAETGSFFSMKEIVENWVDTQVSEQAAKSNPINHGQ